MVADVGFLPGNIDNDGSITGNRSVYGDLVVTGKLDIQGANGEFSLAQFFRGGIYAGRIAVVHSNVIQIIGGLSTTDYDLTSNEPTKQLYGIYSAPSLRMEAGHSFHACFAGQNYELADGQARTLDNCAVFEALGGSKGANVTITNKYGLYIYPQTLGNTNNFGAYIGGPTGSGINYGLFISAPSGGSSNCGFYNQGTAIQLGSISYGSYQRINVITPPGAAEGSACRLYADTSGGKVRLMVIFPTGSAVPLAAEA